MASYFAAGQLLSASRLNTALEYTRPRKYVGHATSGMTSLNGTAQNIPGCWLDISASTSGAKWYARAVFDYQPGSLLMGRLNAGGTIAVGEAHHQSGRSTVTMQWDGTLPSAGTWPFVLCAAVTGASGELFADHTRLEIDLYEAI